MRAPFSTLVIGDKRQTGNVFFGCNVAEGTVRWGAIIWPVVALGLLWFGRFLGVLRLLGWVAAVFLLGCVWVLLLRVQR